MSLLSAIIHTSTARRMSTDATHHWQPRHLSCYLAFATVPTAMLDRSALVERPNGSRASRPLLIVFDVYRKVISLKKGTGGMDTWKRTSKAHDGSSARLDSS